MEDDNVKFIFKYFNFEIPFILGCPSLLNPLYGILECDQSILLIITKPKLDSRSIFRTNGIKCSKNLD